MFGEINHPLYPRATVAEADAVAWVAGSKNAELQQYPFKFQALEPTEVRLKVLYTSICRSDIMHLRGYWGDQHYPCCPGHEIIGQITLTGSAVTNLKAGDKVGVSPTRFSDMSCRYCKMEHTQLCEKRILTYGFQFGGYCTHVQIDHNWAIKLPEGLDLKEAPPLLCAGVTVYAPLKRFNIIKGKCAVIGIGGLGHLSIQYANKLGMEVTAFTTRVQNTQSLRQLGASDVQHSTDPERLRQNAGKYDIVVSTLFIQDAELYKLHQRLLKKGGVYIMVGAPNTSFAYPIDNQYLVDNEITMAGSFIGSIKDINDMLEFSAKYGIKSVNEHFSFEDFPKAFHRSELETPRYRCVINVTDWAKKNGFDK